MIPIQSGVHHIRQGSILPRKRAIPSNVRIRSNMCHREPNPRFPVFRFVILRHQTDDEASHFDWMFAREDPPTTTLLTFRTSLFPFTNPIGESISLQPILDHRIAYLTYEGRISEGRGCVKRIGEGWYRRIADVGSAHPDSDLTETAWRIELSWDQPATATQFWEFRYDNSVATRIAPDDIRASFDIE